MLKLKLCFFKFLGIFIPYFKRKFMNTVIYNHLKNEVENHLKKYDKESIFVRSLIINTEKPLTVIYSITFQDVIFKIGIEYVNNQIKFSFTTDAIPSNTIFFEIADFLKHVESMPQEDLKRRIEDFLSKN